MGTMGERLREAIGRWGSIRRFQREMRARQVRGSSYPRIYCYLKGEIVPPEEFVAAAAHLLGVRLEWLVEGIGEPTVAEVVQQRAAREDLHEQVAEEMAALVAREFPPYRKLPAAARALIWEAFQHHNGHALMVSVWSGGEKLSHLDVAQRIGRALMAPLQALRLDPGSLPARQIGEYVEVLCLALKMLVPEPFARGPMAELQVDDDATGPWILPSMAGARSGPVAGR